MPVYSDGSEWRPKPDEVPSNWKSLDLEEQAGRLQGHLLILIGEEDENIPPGSPLRFVDALMKADKDFELALARTPTTPRISVRASTSSAAAGTGWCGI